MSQPKKINQIVKAYLEKISMRIDDSYGVQGSLEEFFG